MIRTPAFVALGLALALLGGVVGWRDDLGLAIRASSALASAIPGQPPTPLSLVAEPFVLEVHYETSNATPVTADVYLPQRRTPGPALILMPGVLANVREYQPLVDAARGFARAGFVVLVPQGLDYDNYRVLPEDIDALVAGFRWLARHPTVDAERIGFVGFSVGGSLAFIAAADPRIADDVALVAMVGAYYSLDAVLQAVTTHTARDTDGVLGRYQPDPLAWLVVRNTLVGNLPERSDWNILFDLFSQSVPEPNPEVLARTDVRALSPAGRATYDLFVNRDPARTPALADRLREVTPGLLESISPDAHLDGIRAPVWLLHERADSFIPVGESIRLDRALGGWPRSRLAVLDVLQHVELSVPDLSLQTLAGSYVPGLWSLFTFATGALGNL